MSSYTRTKRYMRAQGKTNSECFTVCDKHPLQDMSKTKTFERNTKIRMQIINHRTLNRKANKGHFVKLKPYRLQMVCIWSFHNVHLKCIIWETYLWEWPTTFDAIFKWEKRININKHIHKHVINSKAIKKCLWINPCCIKANKHDCYSWEFVI